MVRIAGMSLMLLVALGACQRQAPENAAAELRPANPAAERLKSLSPPLRNVGLRNTIRDSGAHCDRVDNSAYQQEYRNLSMWTAHCTDTGDFAVFVGPNGEGQVRPCAQATALGIPECRKAQAPAAG
jgi:hypothetical protein